MRTDAASTVTHTNTDRLPAVRVQDAGAGLWLDKHDFTAEALAAAVERVATETTFREVMPELQRALAAPGGVRRAADLIAETASRARR